MAFGARGHIIAAFFMAASGPAQAADEQLLRASPAFRTAAEQTRVALAAGNLAGASAGLAALVPVSPLEKYMAASLAMEIAVARNDLVAQRAAVARMIDSGAAPEGELPRLNHIAGYLAARAGATDAAVTYLSRARALGLNDPKASLLLVESYVRLRRPDDASMILDETIAASRQAGQTVPASWYDRAASLALSRKDWARMATASAAKLAEPSSNGPDWRSAIVTYLSNAQPEKEAALDLYRLQSAAGGMASERDYHAYAAAAIDLGYAEEGRSVLDAGLASGALTKSDTAVASLQRSAQTAAKAARGGVPGASRTKAEQDGDAALSLGRFADAVRFYQAAFAGGGADRDRLSARLGIALARSGDFEGARKVWAQAKGRWADVAAFWSAWAEARRPRMAPTPAA